MADTAAESGPGCYLYGVARALDPAAVDGVLGVGGAPVRVLTQGTLSALVSPVDLAEFGEAALRRNLEDLGWLERTARAHHAVLAAQAAHPVVPLRLATVYRDEARVRAVLDERHGAFDAALRRVQGRTEWGLKAFLAPQPQPGDPPDVDADPPDAGIGPGPGTAYLLRRGHRRRGAEQRREAATAQADALHAALAGMAEDTRRYPPQSSGLRDDTREMVLNAAYLVPDTGKAALEAASQRVDTGALEVEWTGPWVPYSFAALDGDR